MSLHASTPGTQGNRLPGAGRGQEGNCPLVIRETDPPVLRRKADESFLDFCPKSATDATRTPNGWLFTGSEAANTWHNLHSAHIYWGTPF